MPAETSVGMSVVCRSLRALGEHKTENRIAVSVSDRRGLTTSPFARRGIGPKRARAQLRGRPISEKALVVMECKEAFENTELSPLNHTLCCLATCVAVVSRKADMAARSAGAPLFEFIQDVPFCPLPFCPPLT